MKKVIYIIPIFLLLCVSCAPSKLIPTQRIITSYYFDFSKFSQEGFFISPDNYVGEFESCGELQIIVKPAKKLINGKKVYSSADNSYSQEVILMDEDISGQELLSIIVDKAKEKGGNALVNFRCNTAYNQYYQATTGIIIKEFKHYELKGFVIKRK